MAEYAGTGGGGGGRHAMVARAAYQAGFRGQGLLTAVAIAMAESRANPNAWKNDSVEDSRGLWQINVDPRTLWGRRRAEQYGDLFDPYENARAAYTISDGGTDFSPWSTYTRQHNNYSSWLGKAATAIRSIGQNAADPSSRTMDGGRSQPMVRDGDRGPAVRRLQQLLGGIAVDGIFGPQTEGAVIDYQQANGLQVDGIVGPETWGHLLGSSGGGGQDAGGGGGSGWLMPVAGGTYSNDWGNSRGGGTRTHKGTDIFAPHGTPIRAPVSGRIKTSMYGRSGISGLRVWLEGDDGNDYFFAHMSAIDAQPGQRIERGGLIGKVGNTGNARGTSPHLHLGMRPSGSNKWINPYNFIEGASGDVTAPGTTGTGDFMGINVDKTAKQLAYEQYGASAKFFMEHPEIGPILERAAEEGWGPGRLRGAISNTDWWKKTSETARMYLALKETDPATWRQNLEAAQRSMRRLAEQVGINLSPARIKQLADQSLRFGWSNADIKSFIVAEAEFLGEDQFAEQAGLLGFEQDWINSRSKQYGVNVAPKWIHEQAVRIIKGEDTREGVEARLKDLAVSRYPWMKEELDSGMTVRDVADPYVQTYAKMMEVNPTTIGLNDRHMQKMLDYREGDNRRTMALWEAEDYIRSTKKWKETDQAKEQYASSLRDLAKMFGATF